MLNINTQKMVLQNDLNKCWDHEALKISNNSVTRNHAWLKTETELSNMVKINLDIVYIILQHSCMFGSTYVNTCVLT